MIRRFLMSLSLLGMIMVATPTTALAYNPFGGAECTGDSANSAVCAEHPDGSDPISGSGGLLIRIANIVAYIAGAAAVIVLIVGAIKYVTSSGDSNNVSNAKNTIINALIGIVVIAIARVLIVYLINHL